MSLGKEKLPIHETGLVEVVTAGRVRAVYVPILLKTVVNFGKLMSNLLASRSPVMNLQYPFTIDLVVPLSVSPSVFGRDREANCWARRIFSCLMIDEFIDRPE